MREKVFPAGTDITVPVLIYFNDEKVWTFYHKDTGFIDIVKKMDYRWNGDSWYKSKNSTINSMEEIAIELGNVLLNNGYPIEMPNGEALEKAINAEYEPECTRWIKLRTSGKYEGKLVIIWRGRNDKLYNIARSLPRSKWDSGVVIGVEYFKELMDFAELYDFKFSKKAKGAIEKHIDILNKVRKVKPKSKYRPQNHDKLNEILNSEEGILDDLKD